MKRFNIVLSLLILLTSCLRSQRDGEAVVAEWTGKEIVMPTGLKFHVLDNEVNIDSQTPDFKIINFIDSSGCTACKMKLHLWSDIINEFKSIPDVDVLFLTIVNADSISPITSILKQNNYLYPVAIDSDNTFANSNNLPDKSAYHTFLLDADNKVIAIGNPVLNPKIKKLYKQIIMNDEDLMTRFGKLESRTLGVVSQNDEVSTKFYIYNSDSIPYHIQNMIPSCDCVSATVNRLIIQPETEAMVNITFHSDTLSGSFNQYVDVFFQEREFPYRFIIYGFTN